MAQGHWLNSGRLKREKRFEHHERHPGVAKRLRQVAHRWLRRRMRRQDVRWETG